MFLLFLSITSLYVQISLSYTIYLDKNSLTSFNQKSLIPSYISKSRERHVRISPLKSTLLIPPPFALVTSTSHEREEKLPWKTSIHVEKSLSYMPMLERQLDIIKELGLIEDKIDSKFVFKSSAVKPAKIASLCFKNEKFRKVRMTYIDAGDSVQVFNTLWYPSYEYELPLFGVDLISLGKNRVLCVIDCQPLHPTTEYSDKYINSFSDIRDKYPDLHGKLSGKIYDDTSFFSKNLLFGRFTDESKLQCTVLPAFEEYLQNYILLMDQTKPNMSSDFQSMVKERQQKYDEYSALKDPAVGLFDAYFGKEWSHSFVHDFLFSLCKESPNEYNNNVHNFKIDNVTGNVSPVSVKN